MATKEERLGEIQQKVSQINRSIVPFTGGLLIFIYAFFWPESYGHWLGAIVRAFRDTAGF
jgi:hypothetical protein